MRAIFYSDWSGFDSFTYYYYCYCARNVSLSLRDPILVLVIFLRLVYAYVVTCINFRQPSGLYIGTAMYSRGVIIMMIVVVIIIIIAFNIALFYIRYNQLHGRRSRKTAA